MKTLAEMMLDEFNELNKGFYPMPDGVESKEDYKKRWEKHITKSIETHLHSFVLFEKKCDEILDNSMSTEQIIELFKAWIHSRRL